MFLVLELLIVSTTRNLKLNEMANLKWLQKRTDSKTHNTK